MPTSNSRFQPLQRLVAFRRCGAFALFLALSVVGIGLAVRPSLARQNPQELVRQGDKSWNEQSYKLALEAYQKALTADPKLPNRPEIAYRIMVALGRAKKWDQAIAATEGYVATYRDKVWEARWQVWRGRLYRIVEHSGYKVGEKNQLGATALVIVSDMALVQKVDKESVLAYVADSKTGKPMPGVKLTVWEPVRLYSDEPELAATYVRGATDSEGQFRTALPIPVGDEGRNQTEVHRRAQVFAFAGSNRYAVAPIAYFENSELPQGDIPNRGVQEAGVRGHRHAGKGADTRRRADEGDDCRTVLFRRPGRERESTLNTFANPDAISCASPSRFR